VVEDEKYASKGVGEDNQLEDKVRGKKGPRECHIRKLHKMNERKNERTGESRKGDSWPRISEQQQHGIKEELGLTRAGHSYHAATYQPRVLPHPKPLQKNR
jgi:hypothetical protein